MICVNLLDYVGIPFKYGGNRKTGCDCYGFIRLFYREALGIKLPYLKYTKKTELKRFSEYFDLFPVRLKKPRTFCLLAFVIRNRRLHLGIYLGRGKFIHMTKEGSVIESYEKWRKKVSFILWRNDINGC